MKITEVETILLSIPFDDGGGAGVGITPTAWNALEIALVRIGTDAGLTGWGEGFGYFVTPATKAVIDRLIAPVLTGTELADPAQTCDALQRKLALFGRHGITMFAISGIDMALWDLCAKAEGKPLADLLARDALRLNRQPFRQGQRPPEGGAGRDTLPAYGSLVRYGVPDLAARLTAEAAAEGWDILKLHETDMPGIEACVRAAPDARIIVDVNGTWTPEQTRENLPRLAELGVMWLEEPVFPPEDAATLAALRGTVPLAAGENLCTTHGFAPHLAAGSMDHAQPSITKVGGITEFLRVSAAARAAGVSVMPHSPYFGPGWHATLHLAASDANIGLVEQLWVRPEALPDPQTPLAHGGRIELPQGPGLGFAPDPGILARYRIG